jgi:gluconolactonase
VHANPYEVLDERFLPCRGDRELETLYTGGRWLEGPVYFAAGRYLLFSDVPSDTIFRWDETTGAVGVFRRPSAHANGNTLDHAGRLITCEHGSRRVTRTEHDGSFTVLADRHEGKRFNSPNDVVVTRDRSLWFTDPTYGITSDYEGHRAASEIDGCRVYRLDPDSGACQIVANDFDQPNGLAFSAEERRLYVTDSSANHIRVFDVGDEYALSGGGVFADGEDFDGLRLDEAGRVWAATAEGVHCYDPDGTLIGKIRVPEETANLVFGGINCDRLFICATSSLYSIHLKTNGVPPATHTR